MSIVEREVLPPDVYLTTVADYHVARAAWLLFGQCSIQDKTSSHLFWVLLRDSRYTTGCCWLSWRQPGRLGGCEGKSLCPWRECNSLILLQEGLRPSLLNGSPFNRPFDLGISYTIPTA